MKRTIINPWQWQEKLGFVHGNKIAGAENILFVAGQIATDEQGQFVGDGSMPRQLDQILSNLDSILHEANMTFANIVRLNMFTTDMPQMLAHHDYLVAQLKQRQCRHVGTLLGVNALGVPAALVEIEITAMS